jgi:hypothetical protein
MGFDICISLSMELDETTGLPVVYYVNKGFLDKKPYNPVEFQIPEKYRKYIEQRGNYFHSYIKRFSPDCFKASVRDFLELYPDWVVVMKDDLEYYDYDDSYWNEEKHNEFKELLQWMVDKSPYICVFEINWSY